MGIIVTPPAGATGKPKPHRSPRNGCADLACPKHVERTRAGRTFATNMLFPRYPKQPQYPRFPQRLKRPLQSRQLNNRLNRKTHIAGSAGVKPSDKPTEQDRPKRDRPRLVFQPIHAVIAIFTLSCALCASLTMLIQQAVHYSALQQSQITQSEQSKANGTEKDKTASTQTTPSQQPSTEPDSQSEPTSGPAEPADPADGLLNINTAGSDELQTLKGVGPVTAQRIIDYRNQIGRFDNVDQLLEVKGIGEKTLAKFRDQVCAR